MDEEESQEGGITLGKIFSMIFSRKWLALILLVAITLIGTLGLYLGYNKTATNYVVSFRLKLPSDKAVNTEYVYPDGKTFHYTTLVSASVLKEVKEDDERFRDIDVESMVNSGAISVKEELTVTQVGTQDSIVDRNYTLTAKASYFSDGEQARAFLTEVANYPRLYLAKMQIEYYSYLNLFETAYDYEKQIEYLNNQANFIIGRYNSLIAEYGEDFIVEGTLPLKSYRDTVNAYYKSYEMANLEAELRGNNYIFYVPGKDAIAAYRTELIQVERDYNREQFILEQMLKSNSDLPANAEAIRAQAKVVANLEQRKTDLNNFIAAGNVDESGAFWAKLQNVAHTLEGYTDTLKSVTDSIYINASSVYFNNTNVIASAGGMSLVICGVVSLLVGLVVACVVAYIVAYAAEKKKEKNTPAAPVAPEETHEAE